MLDESRGFFRLEEPRKYFFCRPTDFAISAIADAANGDDRDDDDDYDDDDHDADDQPNTENASTLPA